MGGGAEPRVSCVRRRLRQAPPAPACSRSRLRSARIMVKTNTMVEVAQDFREHARRLAEKASARGPRPRRARAQRPLPSPGLCGNKV